MPHRPLLALPAALAVAVLAVACSGPAEEAADAGPELPVEVPETRRVDHVDVYHGTEVADPYRWLEELDGEETAAWVGAQNAVAEPFLATIPVRESLEARLTELWNFERYGLPEKEGGLYFYERNDGLQDQDVLYVTASLEEPGRVLVDPNTFSDDATASLSMFVPSPDGKLLAYSVSRGGSDWRTWHIRDVAGGEDLPEVLDQTKFTGVSWSRDSSGFYYSRYPLGTDGEADDQQQVSVWYHAVGTPQEDDVHVYSIPDHPTRNPYAQVTQDGRFLVIYVFEGYQSNGVYVQRLPAGGALPAAAGEQIEPVRLLDAWDARYDFLANREDALYFQTTNGAPRARVVAIDLDRPAPDAWREVVPEAEETLEDASLVGDRVVAQYLKDARSLVRLFALDGAAVGEVELPGIGSASGFEGEPGDPETFYELTAFTTPGQIYRYDVATGESTLWRESSPGGLDLSTIVTEQVFYESADGTRVPMFIVHREGIEQDGTHPTLLYGYGGFNVSLSPRYRTPWVVWIEQGGVLAVANLRGGGEYGEAWHLAGTKAQKQNVFDDFIAAAKYLVAAGWTSTPKLAIQGGSNGGLLVGAVITQRPELVGAALPAVGVLDMLRYHTASANARQWSSDYGLAEDPEMFPALLAYSPYHNIEPGTCYPPTLVTTADHDDRVVPWHSFKFAAALQHAQGCDNPVLIRVETRAGHGAGKPTWMQIDNWADQLAFLHWALGMS